jgi:hypothetical protein
VFGVPGGGTLYLRGTLNACSSVGYDMMRASNITGISIRVDAADASRAYQVQVVTNPDGAPASVAVLALPVSTQAARTVAVSGAIAAGTSWGVRIVRTSGSGASSFGNLAVLVEVDDQ